MNSTLELPKFQNTSKWNSKEMNVFQKMIPMEIGSQLKFACLLCFDFQCSFFVNLTKLLFFISLEIEVLLGEEKIVLLKIQKSTQEEEMHLQQQNQEKISTAMVPFCFSFFVFDRSRLTTCSFFSCFFFSRAVPILSESNLRLCPFWKNSKKVSRVSIQNPEEHTKMNFAHKAFQATVLLSLEILLVLISECHNTMSWLQIFLMH